MADWDAYPIVTPAPTATQPLLQQPAGWDAFPKAPTQTAATPAFEEPGLEKLAHTPWSGSILPLSGDASGNWGFDPNAGLLGMGRRLFDTALSAARAPGDVYTGRLPIMSEGQYNPAMIDRAAAFSMFSPSSAALKAGEMIPGELARALGAPTAEQLKAAGGAGYDAARAAGLDVRGDAVANMARELQNGLQQEQGIIAKTAPKTFAILDELGTPPKGGFATIPGLEAARRGLSGIAGEGGTEGLAAGNAVRRIDDFLGSLSPKDVLAGGAAPEDIAATLRDARGNYAAAMRSNDLTGTLDRANTGILAQAEARAAAANSGHNLDNSIRQRVASLLQRPNEVAGFSDPEIAALNDLVQGSRTQNFLRSTSNLLGGGGGLGQMAASTLGAILGGYTHGGMEGAGAGAAIGGSLGKGLKAAENELAKRRLGAVDEMIRARSPLGEQMAGATAPSLPANAILLRALVGDQMQPGNGTASSPLTQLLAGANAGAIASPF